MFVKPKAGAAVPDPERGGFLPESGATVPENQYWLRREADQEIERVDADAPTTTVTEVSNAV
ncbi:DUF2635 domain-containing protein [Amantichitinum ursilacus]|uniref:DUF2635 domain-containing protein n=1 Tax=Amantichitinum ursilacus TaxID=857265 RepID=A0A0N0XIS8_9NEIS|nr:DUF2635 domain-containing protein [Amantichitinum ursilacus]KPC53026.1 hypothetical protein WG78_11065 [Amantichitinum ursilacus]